MLRDAAIQVPQSVQDKINAVTDVSDIRQVALNAMAEAGLIVRTHGDDYQFNSDAVERPAASNIPADRPAPEEKCMRVIYPRGNNRFELYGTSETQLDEQQRQIEAMFSRQR